MKLLAFERLSLLLALSLVWSSHSGLAHMFSCQSPKHYGTSYAPRPHPRVVDCRGCIPPVASLGTLSFSDVDNANFTEQASHACSHGLSNTVNHRIVPSGFPGASPFLFATLNHFPFHFMSLHPFVRPRHTQSCGGRSTTCRSACASCVCRSSRAASASTACASNRTFTICRSLACSYRPLFRLSSVSAWGGGSARPSSCLGVLRHCDASLIVVALTLNRPSSTVPNCLLRDSAVVLL